MSRLLTVLLLSLAMFLSALGLVQAQEPPAMAKPATCSNPVTGNFVEGNVIFSGTVYLGDSLTFRRGVTLTISPGTEIVMCGRYDLTISEDAALVARGTLTEPIIITPTETITRWGALRLQSTYRFSETVIEHVQLHAGGYGSGGDGALELTDFTAGGTIPGPFINHLTIDRSLHYGMVVRFDDEDDPLPPSFSNLRISNSGAAAIKTDVGVLSELGTGNSFSGNQRNTIEIGPDSGVDRSQTWPAQPVPYELSERLIIGSGSFTPVLTLAPGVSVVVPPDTDFTVGNSLGRYGGLVAVGTLTQPITFDTAVPGQKWGALEITGNTLPVSTTLQHVVLNNGGGNNPGEDSAALRVALENAVFLTEIPVPVIDHVRVNDSGGYGIWVSVDEGADATPPSLTNLSINNSASHPLLLDAGAVSGLGQGHSFTNHLTNTIKVGPSGLNTGIFFSQRWQAQPIPYYLPEGIYVRDNSEVEPFSTFVLDPGVTLLLGPDADVTIGSLFGDAVLVAEGTATQPITFTRATTAPWGSLGFSVFGGNDSRLAYVNLMGGGGSNPSDLTAVLGHTGDGNLSLNHVNVLSGTAIGVSKEAGVLRIRNSRIENNRLGVRVSDSRTLLRNNIIRNNADGGLVNASSDEVCVDALGNDWGSPDGPLDADPGNGQCGQGGSNVGSGNSVSAGVLYRPWLTAGETLGRSQIIPAEHYVVANGISSTTITIRVLDADGNPLAGQTVALSSTLGTVTQPTAPTDTEGETTASITGTVTGFAHLTARNVSAGSDLAALAGITFWSGGGDLGGLVAAGGAPYNSPQFSILRPPYVQGVPMTFLLPMQNSRTEAVTVSVQYGVSDLNIGARFTPVYTETRVLQPGQSWNGAGFWVPPYTGHRCVEATVTVETPDAARQVNLGGLLRTEDFSSRYQQNTDTNPCKPNRFDVGSKIPKSAGATGQANLRKTGKTFKGLGDLLGENMRCFDQQVTFRGMNAARSYEAIAPTPTYNSPTVAADADTSPALAAALNDAWAASTRLRELRAAIEPTEARMAAASQAQAWLYAANQFAAYQTLLQAYAGRLDELADAIDAVLAETEGAGIADEILTFDPAAEAADLRLNGFDAETLDTYRQLGLSDDEIERMRQDLIDQFENDPQPARITSLYTELKQRRDGSRRIAADLRTQFPTQSRNRATAGPPVFNLAPLEADFVVGNPTAVTATVELRVRPINLPLDWSYELNQDRFELAPNELVTATLTLEAGRSTPENTQVSLAVEGYIADELIGGVVINRRTPTYLSQPVSLSNLYLPLTLR